MTDLFTRGFLGDYTNGRMRQALAELERINEDEVLRRSTDDVVSDLVARAYLEPLVVGKEPIDGGVAEGTIEVPDAFERYGRTVRRAVFNIHAVYEFSGNPDLLYYTPTTSLALVRIRADVDTRQSTLTVRTTVSAQGQLDAAEARRSFEEEIGRVRTNAGHTARDVAAFNSGLEARIRPAVERRKQHLQSRRDLSGALGFPLQRREDAPNQVPMARKQIGTVRTAVPRAYAPYRDEPALTEAQYEDAISVVKSTILAMERSPSVVAHKDEEEIRDLILVQLNGTFEGNATGETFVKSGKTDLLVRVEDRHVFVGECKWWKGEKSFSNAIDQLLGYLPWRDEKAALIVFISQKDASAVIEKADGAVRLHASFKRIGAASADPKLRRNYVLGHPDDPEREIKVAVLFAVFSASEDRGRA
ncbi:hypothetical protein [Arthrobacter woluwensis]|uniref:hypothetical protein n=1 Tax=Arthrobacter woluwensis TaxID=156980 RepID=UPI0011A80253|nr:hypothetical protein [Arthrobacter woluwensis]